MEGLLKKKICKPGTILNKKTGRCIQKTGNKGKNLVKSVTFAKSCRKSPRKKYN